MTNLVMKASVGPKVQSIKLVSNDAHTTYSGEIYRVPEKMLRFFIEHITDMFLSSD